MKELRIEYAEILKYKEMDLYRIPLGKKRGAGTADCSAKHRFPVRCRVPRKRTESSEGRTKSLSQGGRKVRVTAVVLLPGLCFLGFWRNAQPSRSDNPYGLGNVPTSKLSPVGITVFSTGLARRHCLRISEVLKILRNRRRQTIDFPRGLEYNQFVEVYDLLG